MGHTNPLPDAEPSPQTPAALGKLRSRLSVYGVFWSRFLDWGVRRTPFFLEPAILAGYTLGFFIFAGRQRRAVLQNLRTLLPEMGPVARLFGSLRVFWEFAWMVTDAAHARASEDVLEWSLDGAEHFNALISSPEGAIVLTAHMGSYDVAAPFFAGKFGRRVTMVRIAERRAELQRYMGRERAAQETDSFRIRYNHPGEFLGIDLARALAAGEVVAAQGDRVPGEVSQLRIERNGKPWLIPRGPFVLAQVSGALIYPLFIIREGWRRYRIIVRPPRRIAGPIESREARAERLCELARWWVETLDDILVRRWWLWLAFDEMFESAVREAAAAGDRGRARVSRSGAGDPCHGTVLRGTDFRR
jgi:lauroyl/myristoyl acyltransferase